MTKGEALAKLGLCLLAVGFTGVFFINWCDLVYQCGCTFLWTGASAQCNIHQAQPPHCPWCTNTTAAGGALIFTVLTQTALTWLPGPLTWLRAMAVFAASPIAAAAAGAVIGLAAGYWSS